MSSQSATDAERGADREPGASAHGLKSASMPNLPALPHPPVEAPDRLTALMQHAARGDRGALRALYEAEAGRLRTIALRVTRDPAIADDALHDMFVALIDAPDRYDPARGSARSFLSTRIRYAALDQLRRRGREPPTDDVFEDVAAAIVEAERSADGERIGRCLHQLDARTRRLIVLTVVEGVSHAELARDFALPLGTTKSLIRRGLLALRRCLDA